MTMTYDERIRYYDQLREESMRLEKEIAIAQEKEEFAIAKSLSALLEEFRFQGLSSDWISSVYCTKRKILTELTTSSFSKWDQQHDADMAYSKDLYRHIEYQYYAVLCEAVNITENGVILILSDPYRQVRSQCLDMITTEEAVKLIGRILIIKARPPVLSEDQGNETIHIYKYKKLRITKTGIIDALSGQEKTILSPVYTDLKIKEGITNRVDADIEIKRIEDICRLKGWYVYHERGMEKCLTIVQGTYIYGLIPTSKGVKIIWKEGICLSKEDKELMQEMTERGSSIIPNITLRKVYENVMRK